MMGSSAISAVGGVGQGYAAAGAANYNAKMAQNNAAVAEQNANFAGAVGEENVGAAGAKTKAQVAAITANQGASGVSVGSGSNVDVRESAARVGMLDELNIRSAAARQAYGFQTQAANDLAQSKLDKSEATKDITGGFINAGASILGGAGKAAELGMFGDKSGGLTSTSSYQSGSDYSGS
jgi:hypothetical protein